MELTEAIPEILLCYGLDPVKLSIHRINSGHINYTFKVEPGYILQRINKNVFLNPKLLSNNLRAASAYLKKTVPGYLFLNVIKAKSGDDLVFDKDGYPWRLFPYIKDSITINEVDNAGQAFEAAKAFGLLSKHLSAVAVDKFEETIPQFHNLAWRYVQFEAALSNASEERKEKSRKWIKGYTRFNHLVQEYTRLIKSNQLKLRITHNDTKINNVLFKRNSNEVICVIDLDTLMPGYFIYDLGDMMRTFVSPVSEEESDLSKVVVRKVIYQAIMDGYLSAMDEVLTTGEKEAMGLAGPIMTYMIGLRFLTDYLNGDTYYQISYPEQNLIRAANQFRLLEKLTELR